MVCGARGALQPMQPIQPMHPFQLKIKTPIKSNTYNSSIKPQPHSHITAVYNRNRYGARDMQHNNNRREFLLNLRTAAVAGVAFNLVHGVAAQELRPAELTPPRLTVAQGAETPVVLQAVRIDAEISGSRALTSVEMTFFNPNARVLEGELQFPLLDGQHVAGFALDIDGQLRYAVPVEKAKGQQVFEDVIRARIDPALLETTAGNNYKLRVYPLPARGTRRVLLRYAETLPTTGAQRRYRLPLEYARELANFTLRIAVRAPELAPLIANTLPKAVQGLSFKTNGSDFEAEITRQDFTARGVLEVQLPVAAKPEVHTQQHEGKTYFVAEIPVRPNSAVLRAVPSVIGIIWDASGSGAARDHTREFALLDAYFQRMSDGEVRLTRVRDSAEPTERFRIRTGEWAALKRALQATPYDGATQLGAFAPEAGVNEYLLFSDGLENFGERPFASLSVPLYTVNAATRADPARLRHLAESNGGSLVDLASLTAADAARRLLYSDARILSLDGDGVSDLVAVSRSPDGGRWLVAGRLQGDAGTLRVMVNYPRSRAFAQGVTLPIRAGHNADTLAAAAWGQLRIAQLDGEHRLHRAEIRRLGMAFGLTSRETSLIVLDRIEDYVRNEIAPPAELRAAYDEQRRHLHLRAANERAQQLERVVHLFKEKIAWWEKDFPKGPRPQAHIKPKLGESARGEGALMQERQQNFARDRADAPAGRLE
ncbi:MAG: hypothetical protein FJY56_21700, partial [Betaproteobacteria bacterium]|nr:hypothetical protein [Betaproteobacteria bacterium]